MVRMPLNIVGNTDVRIQFIYDGTVLYGNSGYNNTGVLKECNAINCTVHDNDGGWDGNAWSVGGMFGGIAFVIWKAKGMEGAGLITNAEFNIFILFVLYLVLTYVLFFSLFSNLASSSRYSYLF